MSGDAHKLISIINKYHKTKLSVCRSKTYGVCWILTDVHGVNPGGGEPVPSVADLHS